MPLVVEDNSAFSTQQSRLAQGDLVMKKAVKIPEGWVKGSLSSFTECFSGGTPSRSNSEFYEGTIPWVKSGEVNNRFIFDTEEKISESAIRESSAKLVNPNSILVAMYGATAGKVAILKVLAATNQAVLAMNPVDSNLCSDFLFWVMEHEAVQLMKKVQGAAQPNLSKNLIGSHKVTIPPLPEQKAIADLLSTWDEAIEKTERLIQVKEKQLRQMSRWLLFGHKRLGNQKNELADGHFFKYPSDWALVKIGKVAKEVSARNGESEETVLSCSKYDGFVNSLDYFGKQVFSSDTSNYKVVKKEQFGYPSNHVEEGSIGLLEHCEKGIVSPIYVVFEASKEKVHSPYLYKLLKTDIYRHIFQVSTSSSVDRRGSLRWSDFSKIKVLIPSLEEQQEISETLSLAQQEIDLLKQLVDKYKTQKRGMMQKMLTGEWRLKPEIVNQYKEV